MRDAFDCRLYCDGFDPIYNNLSFYRGHEMTKKIRTILTVKPPLAGSFFRLNKSNYEVMDVIPRIGYRPKRWMLEIRRIKK
jgi:hypothetical protein